MKSSPAQVFKYESSLRDLARFRTGVSLHSHTMHSREYLHRLPQYISRVPIASYMIEREVGRVHLYTGKIVNFRKVFWTPPLSAREALDLERGQIEKKLGLRGLVSLSDHDNVEAGLHLRMLEGMEDVPVSVEWSVPYEQTVFHLGVHNLPAALANTWMAELAKFTAKPSGKKLRELLRDLNAERSALVILNHPYWDAESIGPEQHLASLEAFLKKHGIWIHALELNGLRSRRENQKVMKLGEGCGIPVISGGDRHGCEPNAVVNVTNAQTFGEFVEEIRRERRSEIVLMPQYFDRLQLRLLESAWHAMSDAPGEFGRRHWMTRVFHEAEDGRAKPLSSFLGARFEHFVEPFRRIMGLLASPQFRPALRLALRGNEETGL
jgi:hypothetical protein